MSFKVVDDPSIHRTARTGKLVMGILALIAEFENDIRRERQMDGIAKAKDKGVKFGGNASSQRTELRKVTLGSMGEYGRGFLDDVRQAQGKYIGYAMLGGVVFNIANILLVAAIQLAGLSHLQSEKLLPASRGRRPICYAARTEADGVTVPEGGVVNSRTLLGVLELRTSLQSLLRGTRQN